VTLSETEGTEILKRGH